MKTCEKPAVVNEYKHPPAVSGHLYRNRSSGNIYIAVNLASSQLMVLGEVKTGQVWSSNTTFGSGSRGAPWNMWDDVTDQWCLTEL